MSEQFDKRKRKNREKHDANFDNMMKKAGHVKDSNGKGDKNIWPADKDSWDDRYGNIKW